MPRIAKVNIVSRKYKEKGGASVTSGGRMPHFPQFSDSADFKLHTTTTNYMGTNIRRHSEELKNVKGCSYIIWETSTDLKIAKYQFPLLVDGSKSWIEHFWIKL